MNKENETLRTTRHGNDFIADVSGSYIRIEIVDYFGTKKVIEVKPYFDKQQLTEIEFLNAIRLLEEEKNKATYAFV